MVDEFSTNTNLLAFNKEHIDRDMDELVRVYASHGIKNLDLNFCEMMRPSSRLNDKRAEDYIKTLGEVKEELGLNYVQAHAPYPVRGTKPSDWDGKIIKAFPFKDEDLKNIKELFDEKKTAIMAVEEDDLYLNIVTEAAIMANAAVSIPLPRTGMLSGKPIYQLICYGSVEEIGQITEKLNAKAVWWNEQSVDVIPLEGGKDRGIEALLETLGLRNDEIIVFGDGMNDVPMFALTPYSVAMGNAIDEVKTNAAYVTNDIDDDGIYNALKHFNVI